MKLPSVRSLLPDGAGQREGRHRRRSRLLPPEPSGADSAGEEPGRAERTVTKLLSARRTTADLRQGNASRGGDAGRARASAGIVRGGFELAEPVFQTWMVRGLLEVAHELLLDATEAGEPASETAAGLCRDLAGTGVRGAARAQFR